MDIGRVGIWTFQLDLQPMARAQELAAELEELGYGAIWVPEAVSREAVANSALILSATSRITVCTGIASIWARDPMAMAQAHKTLTEAFPDRFLLGLGVSHEPMVEGLRHQNYDRPYSAMKAYLDAMDAAPFFGVPPTAELQRVLAALGPKMLALSAERARGAHPYFVPVEHTAEARGVLGTGPLLAPEQAAVLETDPGKAREIARQHMATYLGLPNYTNNLRRYGFGDDDIENGGSDRLVDAIVAWGDVDTVVQRVRAHHDAGADHVCVQVLASDIRTVPQREWRELAEALL
jgi:probable F420-dependent oxidoreductase